jgi:hypothetical protein
LFISWTSDGKNKNHIDRVFIDRTRDGNIGVLDARRCSGIDYDTDQCLVAAKVRERPSVNKRATLKLDMKKFDVKKVKMWKFKAKTKNRSAALESLHATLDINTTWGSVLV